MSTPHRSSSSLRPRFRIPPRLATLTSLLAAVSFALWLRAPAATADDDPAPQAAPSSTRLIAWNDLGMHCMDPDYSVFALLPPFNDFKTQLIVNGKLQKAGTLHTVRYRAIADADGSINKTSIGKTDFWDHVTALFGVALAPDQGLAGHDMPGPANVLQATAFDPAWNWFAADGVPITPYDDDGTNDTYPRLEGIAYDAGGTPIAATANVTPVSDEMDCARCHASAGSPWAKPIAGWTFESDPIADYRFNILRLHDERNAANPVYAQALASLAMDAAGLEATVRQTGRSVLCASCHLSNALPGSGLPGISALTSALHLKHAPVVDSGGLVLDAIDNRSACYECHPGSVTRCLRGAMGSAVASDGTLSMQCQSCHGGMTEVGDPSRTGWLDQPSCQECHTGTATQNSGQIRFTSVFDQNGNPHVPADLTFATNPNVPAPGFDLYRFSSGHGGLNCEACHGSTHAEYPSFEPKDNLQSIAIQGHAGMLVECNSCHGTTPFTVNGGPHGMHSIGQTWVNEHGDIVEVSGAQQCRACHGTDFRGTVLSYSQADRSFATKFGTQTFFDGGRVGCFHCHNGPSSGDPINNSAPVVTNKSVSTPNDAALAVDLTGFDSNGHPLTYRIVSQPAHGTVGLVGATATYFPEAGFLGTTTFTFAAWDNRTDSNLGVVTVNVTAATCPGSAEPYGFGCPGSGGHLPQLSLSGCAAPGSPVVLDLENGLGGAPAIVFLGLTEAKTMLPAGCVLRVGSLLPFQVTIPLSGVGAGNGEFHVGFTIPPAVHGVARMQAFIVDPGVWQGFAATAGLRIEVP